MSDAPTLFDKIIHGVIPSYKVYEDDHVYAFLDISPQSYGHTLVVPKESIAHLHELSDDASAALGRALPRLCRAVMRATGASAYNVLQNNGSEAGQAVFHVHFHIIPRVRGDGLKLQWHPTGLSEDDAQDLLSKMHEALADES
jgi:histidine triad (HIT) family protein